MLVPTSSDPLALPASQRASRTVSAGDSEIERSVDAY